ncbi:MAG: PASTA domain-containing protein, partial [Coprobacillus sp.]
QVTQTDTIMGSLHYLAPEIARGEKATAQSDIYALGIVFYELLRGEVPFNGESPVNIALKHMRDEIPSVRSFNPSIPQSVENIIIKATAKNIHDRYQKASQMFDDLNTCLARENEEKLVFDYQEDELNATIVAQEKEFFTQAMPTPKMVEEEVEVKKDNKKKIGIIAGVVVGALLLCVAVYFLLLKPSDTFSMPGVENMTQAEAISYIESKGLKVSEIVHQELSDTVDEGKVISTDPLQGTAVKKNDVITLTISSGKYIIIENFVGQTYSDVESKLFKLGFDVKKEEVNSEVEKGKIIEQSLDVGKKVDPNATNKTITFKVSKGYSQTVPNVLGVGIEEAKTLLAKADFVVTLKVLPAPTSADVIKTMKINVVQSQSLKAFTVVDKKGTEIVLEYYDKKPELPVTTPDPVTPDTGGTNTTTPNN